MDREASNRGPRKQRSAEDFDILLGFLGLWSLTGLVFTMVMEFTGRPALLPALGLLMLVLASWAVLRLRRTLPRRTERRLD